MCVGPVLHMQPLLLRKKGLSNGAQERITLHKGMDTGILDGCSGSTRSPPFIADPPQVLFEDFEPGSTYYACVKLTNASGHRASCRALGTAACVADVLEVEMQPPGFLSSGMSCHMQVKFNPQLNDDINTQITVLTNCGRIVVPVACLRKRAKLDVSASLIEFGSCIIGEKRTRTFELQNSGALQVYSKQ